MFTTRVFNSYRIFLFARSWTDTDRRSREAMKDLSFDRRNRGLEGRMRLVLGLWDLNAVTKGVIEWINVDNGSFRQWESE